MLIENRYTYDEERRDFKMIVENKYEYNKEDLASIKRPGYIDKCSKEEKEWRILETAKCKRDIVYFAEKYFRVINLDKGLHVISLYDVQKEFLQFLVNNNKVVCVSGRQQGKCVYKDTIITIRNKKTGNIEKISIEEFFNRFQNSK